MNKKETEEIIQKIVPLMQAFAEGKIIECNYDGIWEEEDDPNWDPNYLWRIQPEKKIIPFTIKYIEENLYIMESWLKYKFSKSKGCSRITRYDETGIYVDGILYSYVAAVDTFTFTNEKPFGKEEKK